LRTFQVDVTLPIGMNVCGWLKLAYAPIPRLHLLVRLDYQLLDELAEWLHDRYEKHSKYHDWETQKDCKVKFDDLPEENKKVMQSLAQDILIKFKGNKKRTV